GLDLSDRDSHFSYHWHTLSDVAGRSNHRTRNRQWYFLDNHGGDGGASASGAGASVENFCANRGRRKPGKSGDSRLDGGLLVCGDSSGDHHHAKSSENFRAIRQARGRPKNVRRAIDLHAVESELRWSN